MGDVTLSLCVVKIPIKCSVVSPAIKFVIIDEFAIVSGDDNNWPLI